MPGKMKTVWDEESSGSELNASATLANSPALVVLTLTTIAPGGGLVLEIEEKLLALE